MKIPTASALLIPFAGLIICPLTPAYAGPVVAGGCAAVCVTASLGCHGISHSTLSLFSGGLLAAPTFLACHAVLQSCLGGCAFVVITPTIWKAANLLSMWRRMKRYASQARENRSHYGWHELATISMNSNDGLASSFIISRLRASTGWVGEYQ